MKIAKNVRGSKRPSYVQYRYYQIKVHFVIMRIVPKLSLGAFFLEHRNISN